MTDDRFRALPSVDLLVLGAIDRLPAAPAPARPLIVEAARAVLVAERDRLRRDPAQAAAAPDALVPLVVERALGMALPVQDRVINATGVVLHTNLGRAPLSVAAQAAVEAAARGYVALEYDVDAGQRSTRAVGVESWLCRLTGAEAALVVNNGAAALLLAVSALAQGRKVLVSRGELVEIGGSFRLPEILAKAGATLVEVGTTNRTRIDDYRRALTQDVALLLRIHPSNFRLVGFHERPTRGELAALAKEKNLPFVEDIGSGALVDTAEFGLEHEPMVVESLTEGADVVTFSGDKLLGGPQAGLVVGRRDWIAILKRDPLARALRVDKLTIAALEATLAAYVDPAVARVTVPTLAMLAAPASAIQAQAERLRVALEGQTGLEVSVEPEASEVGGGALPGAVLPTVAIALVWTGGSAAALERRLRLGRPPLIARIKDDRVLLDARTLLHEDPEEIARVVRAAVRED
jgi:L-seryl-tRNA(Ser) seleniumtransferase